MPLSGLHDFAGGSSLFHFEELQIYGNAHLAIKPPDQQDMGNGEWKITPQWSEDDITASHKYNVSFFFKYMIGDRTGTVHIGADQDLDLERQEIDLPFNAYVYYSGHLGLAPDTYVHGVAIHMAGYMSHVQNLTIHHGGFFWCRHGGHTTGGNESNYHFHYVRYIVIFRHI